MNLLLARQISCKSILFSDPYICVHPQHGQVCTGIIIHVCQLILVFSTEVTPRGEHGRRRSSHKMVALGQILVPLVLQNALLSTVPTLISKFAAYLESWDYSRSRVADSIMCANCDTPESYDFIIVGGGSGGSVMSARLSEHPRTRVLLLEAGGEPNPWTKIPFLASLLNQRETDWGYSTVPLQGCGYGFPGRSVFMPHGKALGGSSNVNFMLYMRGNPHDFDNWANITQDSRWSYQRVESYFRKMEDYQGNWAHEAAGSYGRGGPLRVEGLRYGPGLQHFLDAVREFGYAVRDQNVRQSESWAPFDFTMNKGRRFGTYSAYIKSARSRPNLVIHTYSHVTQIIFDGELRATGVSYFRHGVEKRAEATKEIILSAGAINTPQLLMLSGIGPRAHLESVKIQPLLDLPGVGSNFQDHVAIPYGPILLNKPVSFLPERNFSLGNILDYVRDGSGPMAGPLMAIGNGMVSTSSQPSNWPNIMFLVSGQGLSPGLGDILTRFIRTNPSILPRYFHGFEGSDSYFIWQILGLAKSRGEVRLRNGSPFSKPLIDPKYYSDRNGADLKAMLEAFELITNIVENSTALGSALGAHLIPKELPGCEGLGGRYSRTYRECYLRTLTLTAHHASGTAAMGKVGEVGTVVDSELRVVGTKGLRVVDASVMPQVTKCVRLK